MSRPEEEDLMPDVLLDEAIETLSHAEAAFRAVTAHLRQLADSAGARALLPPGSGPPSIPCSAAPPQRPSSREELKTSE
ncbi:hypothetical protein ACIBCO_40550 [Streptomyces violascens]|uniref:hypothetical protein n=1 Tax=Streptomyces violascens TaxID=67381 RepID=UPI0037A1D773